MFEGQPKGLYALSLANTGERFGYYTMLAVFVLFLKANFGFTPEVCGSIYGAFLMFVYFLPLVGGILADKFGYGKMVTLGIITMFLGYVFLAIPMGNGVAAIVAMACALLLISVGTGLFKGNLQVMVGNLYDDPHYAGRRDAAFSIFYMAINIGAMFAPTAAIEIMEWAQNSLGVSEADSYHYAFAVACASLIFSIAIYYGCRSWFVAAEGNKIADKGANAKAGEGGQEVLTPEENKARIVALCLVFAVVTFFWMSFHQNGLTLTLFADEFTEPKATGVLAMFFDVRNLVACIFLVYGLFSAFQSETAKARGISWAVIVAAVGYLVYQYTAGQGSVVDVKAPIFQHFNPCFVVMLTPVSIAVFGALARRGKEPSSPRKIAMGMLVAALGFALMTFGSLSLLSPADQATALADGTASFASPYWLISTYLVLTFGELLLSPIGISFVSKVAPPKLKGAMMGGWFVSTAIGNFLTAVGTFLWGSGIVVWQVWAVFVVLCLLSATFMFSIMKKLEKVA